MVASRRSGRVTVGLFGWMHAGGVGELADTGPGRFTGHRYVELLEEVLLPTVRSLLFPEPEEFYIVQDNSPVHTCRVVKEWFRQQPAITILPHPPRSPDLNPIEHVWSAMSSRMARMRLQQSNAAVTAGAMQAWEELRGPAGLDLTSSLVAGMRHRFNEVIAAGGSYSRF